MGSAHFLLKKNIERQKQDTVIPASAASLAKLKMLWVALAGTCCSLSWDKNGKADPPQRNYDLSKHERSCGAERDDSLLEELFVIGRDEFNKPHSAPHPEPALPLAIAEAIIASKIDGPAKGKDNTANGYWANHYISRNSETTSMDPTMFSFSFCKSSAGIQYSWCSELPTI